MNISKKGNEFRIVKKNHTTEAYAQISFTNLQQGKETLKYLHSIYTMYLQFYYRVQFYIT